MVCGRHGIHHIAAFRGVNIEGVTSSAYCSRQRSIHQDMTRHDRGFSLPFSVSSTTTYERCVCRRPSPTRETKRSIIRDIIVCDRAHRCRTAMRTHRSCDGEARSSAPVHPPAAAGVQRPSSSSDPAGWNTGTTPVCGVGGRSFDPSSSLTTHRHLVIAKLCSAAS